MVVILRTSNGQEITDNRQGGGNGLLLPQSLGLSPDILGQFCDALKGET